MNGQSLIGHSKPMAELRRAIRKAAPADMTVLVQGETGTGKELVARAIHEESRRVKGPFVAMNCANLPETLVESLLFGYVKGAFSGADSDRQGKFEMANRGTLFLDEIGEISLAVQAKLLRVLQEHEVERVGGQKPVPVDFRLIAATNRDLETMVKEGAFREDLYYRLNVELIRTPALREMREDIPELARHFAEQYGRQAGKTVEGISPEVLRLLDIYSWPGNVRELQNVIQRAVVTGEDAMVVPDDLPPGFSRKTVLASVKLRNHNQALEDLSRQLCVCALVTASGNGRRAARLLEMDKSTFHRLAKRHGLEDQIQM